ncbi:RHS repeat-associated core domain-containing protein [uncultured Flavobacterium sp.]|uniref:RHS repeat-associated core domain-containing protein n=1 Tax=uncultured Flavobacterium sp. TaxID=165435 RepID=UPI0027E1C8A8|nr:RHS repeat-associated core domain-containing protein [uncultured Flavobacterium sp.]
MFPYNYKYNGKEFQNEMGMDLYDYGARNYDPALGRFLQVDPITHHNQSPYVAFDNNPIVFVDPDGADSKDPIKESITVITSIIDKSNVTHITQTTTHTTTIINDDGSVSVSYSTSSITNTVDAYGNVTNGKTVTTTSGTITRETGGDISSTTGETITRNANNGELTSGFREWTSTVSNYNKNNDGIYNIDMINKTADYTIKAGKAGFAILGNFAGFNKLFNNLDSKTKSAIGILGSYTSAEGLVGQSGAALKDMVGKNNSYAILYGVEHIQNGTMIKAMKTPSGSGAGERKRVGPTSFQQLWKGIKSIFD